MVQPPLIYGPGIYTQEVPSGTQTIVGVSTSVTAFVGRFASGPLGVPFAVSDYPTAVAMFGGIVPDSPVTYALRDFFLNGGTQALIVRLYGAGASASSTASGSSSSVSGGSSTSSSSKSSRASSSSSAVSSSSAAGSSTSGGSSTSSASSSSSGAGPTAATGTAVATAGGVSFAASSPGKWGNNLAVTIVQSNPQAAARYAPLGLAPADCFDVQVVYTPNPALPKQVVTETIPGVSSVPGTRQIDLMLAQNSKYVRALALPAAITAAASTALAGGGDSPYLTPADYTDTVAGFASVLKKARIVNILVMPPDTFVSDLDPTVIEAAATFCQQNLAFFIAEPPSNWTSLGNQGAASSIQVTDLSENMPDSSDFAATYFPPPVMPGQPAPYPVSGIAAGIYSYTDATRGVWKAPAGLSALIGGASGLSIGLSGTDRQALNSQGINALRDVQDVGTVMWGARTLNGADVIGSDYKYVPIRRLTSYIEASLTNGIQWAMFEPNDETLWSRLRLSIGSFMNGLFRQGAFSGTSAKDAYFVNCDATTTTPTDQAAGVVNVVVGFAPVMPAEFIILYIQQSTASSS
jgi:uncharacterized protein